MKLINDKTLDIRTVRYIGNPEKQAHVIAQELRMIREISRATKGIQIPRLSKFSRSLLIATYHKIICSNPPSLIAMRIAYFSR